ncbi:MAG: glycosyltransferase [Planctomycetes bacterium]|nr:glycosyltransferase [Planctomycetota bacterium]
MPTALQVLVDVWNPRDTATGALAARVVDGLRRRHADVDVWCGRVATATPLPFPHRELGGVGATFDRAILAERDAGRLQSAIAFRGLGPIGGVLIPFAGLAADRGADGTARRRQVGLAAERCWFEHAGEEALLLAPSVAVADAVRRCYPGYAGQLLVQPPRVHADHFRPPSELERRAARTVLGLAPDDRVLLWLGADPERGGRELAVAVHRALCDAGAGTRLVLAGPGARRSPATDGVVTVASFRDRRSLYHAADVLLRPTLVAHGDTAVAEALATGLAVVTSQLDAGATLLDAASIGHAVEDPRDVGALARACRAELLAGLGPARRSDRREVVAHRFVPRIVDTILAAVDRAVAS